MATATNKKPAPAQPPANKPHATNGAKPTDKPQQTKPAGDGAAFWKLPATKRLSVRLGNLATRLQTQAIEEIQNWPGETLVAIRAKLATALTEVKSAAEELARLPDDYQPRAKGGGSKVELLPGSLVRVTDKRVGEYEGVLSAKEMRGMKVTEIRGNKVFVVFHSDTDGKECSGFFPRGHVCPDVG